MLGKLLVGDASSAPNIIGWKIFGHKIAMQPATVQRTNIVFRGPSPDGSSYGLWGGGCAAGFGSAYAVDIVLQLNSSFFNVELASLCANHLIM